MIDYGKAYHRADRDGVEYPCPHAPIVDGKPEHFLFHSWERAGTFYCPVAYGLEKGTHVDPGPTPPTPKARVEMVRAAIKTAEQAHHDGMPWDRAMEDFWTAVVEAVKTP